MNGKKIIIFGSESKLGIKLKKSLVKKGCTVISCDQKLSNKKKLIKKNKRIYEFGLDVRSEKSVKNFYEIIKSKIKKIDGIVFSVTKKTTDFYYPFKDFSYKNWKNIIDTELGGAFLVSKYFAEFLASKRNGSFVFISSIYGVVGNDHSIYKGSNLAKVYSNKKQTKTIFSNAAYSTSKGGLISFTKFLATYWVGSNLRFNCISPGGIENSKENKTFIKNYSVKVPLRRKAKIQEVCDAIEFLLSDRSKYINGHNLLVDGGFTAW